jgi:hypothetical protein
VWTYTLEVSSHTQCAGEVGSPSCGTETFSLSFMLLAIAQIEIHQYCPCQEDEKTYTLKVP